MKPTGILQSSVVDPDQHHFGNLDPHPYQIKIRIRIRIKVSVSLGFFYRELSAAGGYNWLPAPLGWKLADARNTKTVENNRNWAELLLHVFFFLSKDPQIHNNHGCKTTISWF